MTICALASIFFSTKAIIVKLAYRQTDVDPVPLLALRMLFSLPFFLIPALIFSSREGNIRMSSKQWMGVALAGVLGYYVSSLLDFLGLKYISAGIERLVLFIYPTLVVLMSAAFFGERVRKVQWLAIILTYFGLTLALFSESTFQEGLSEHFYLGVSLIFACAITYAMYIVGSGKMIPQIGAAKFNSFAMTFAAIGVLTHFLVTGNQSLLHFSGLTYGYSFLMAILATVIPSYLVSEGIKRIGPDNAAIVSSIGPVSTILQAYWLLGEPISILQLAGTVFILTGVLLITWRKTILPI